MRKHKVFVPVNHVNQVFGTYDGFCLEKGIKDRINAIAVIPCKNGFKLTAVTIKGSECVGHVGEPNERILKGEQLNKIEFILE